MSLRAALRTGAIFSLSISSLFLLWCGHSLVLIKSEFNRLTSNMSVFFFTWIYFIFFWFIQDFFKVYTVKFLRKYNVGGTYSSTGSDLPESTIKLIKEMDEAEANGTVVHCHNKH